MTKEQALPWVDLGINEGARDVVAASAVGTGFGRGSGLNSEYELADGWAQVRAIETTDVVTEKPGGYSGVVNEPTYAYPLPEEIKTLETIGLTAATLKYANATAAAQDMASTDTETTTGTQRVRPTSYTGLMAKLIQLLYGLPLSYKGLTRTVSSPFESYLSHGIIKAGGSFWYVAISSSTVGVCKIQGLGIPSAVLKKIKKKVKSTEIDPVARTVGLFGDLPLYTGKPPAYTTILTFPDGPYSSLHPSRTWAFNKTGTEARMIAIARQSASTGAALRGVHRHITFGYDEEEDLPTATYEVVGVTPSWGTESISRKSNILMFDSYYTGLWTAPNTEATWLASQPVSGTLPAATLSEYPMYVYYDSAGVAQYAFIDKTTYSGFSILCVSQELDSVDFPPPKPGTDQWGLYSQYAFYDSVGDWQPTEIPFVLISGSGRPSVWKATGTLTNSFDSGAAHTSMTQDITSSFAALGPGATDTTTGSAVEDFTLTAATRRSQRALIVPRGASERVAVVEAISPSGTIKNTWTFSVSRLVSSGAITDTSFVTRTYTCNDDWHLQIRVYGGPAVHVIPVTLTGVLTAKTGTTAPSAGLSLLDFLPIALDGAFTKLITYLSTGPDLVVESATRAARYVRLTGIDLALSGDPLVLGSWTVTPTYADGASPAIPASDLSTEDGNFSFFGDY